MGKERVRCFVPEGSQKRKATRVRSLRQRWIVNSVVPIFVLLALIVGGVILSQFIQGFGVLLALMGLMSLVGSVLKRLQGR